MYFRRKVLLALIEVFGGFLSAVDCQKLMFLLCERTKENYYDFFPYKYGACSFVLRQDKLRLTDLGYLCPGDAFELNGTSRFLSQVDMITQQELMGLKADIGTLRGENLLRKVYLEYPYFASKSVIASQVLKSNEYKRINKYKNPDTTTRLFTLGYEGISVDSYLNTLIEHNIAVLVDVRKNPISKKYGFSKNQLKRYTECVEISYVHMPELGIASNLRQHLDNEQAYRDLFQQYSEEILPHQTATLLKLKELIYEKQRVALTCFEASYTCCHRSKVAEYFENDPSFEIPIVHL